MSDNGCSKCEWYAKLALNYVLACKSLSKGNQRLARKVNFLKQQLAASEKARKEIHEKVFTELEQARRGE